MQTYITPAQPIAHSVSAGSGVAGSGAVSHRDVLASAAAAGKALGLTGGDVVAVTAPLHTHGGFACGVMATNAAHAKLLLPCKGAAFDAAAALAAMTHYAATALVATPAQAAALEAALAEDAARPAGKRLYDLSALRTGITREWGGMGMGEQTSWGGCERPCAHASLITQPHPAVCDGAGTAGKVGAAVMRPVNAQKLPGAGAF